MAALSLDIGCLYVAQQQLQNAADTAALAAGGSLRSTGDPQTAVQQAMAVAANNVSLGQPVVLDPASDVVFGTLDPATGDFVPGLPTDELAVVKVTARRTEQSSAGPVHLHFAPIFGINTAEVSASAMAGLSIGERVRMPVELVIVHDGSYSFRAEMALAKAADNALVNLISEAAVAGDRMGAVFFCATAWRECDLTGVPDGAAQIENAITGADHCSSFFQLLSQPERYYGTNTGAGIDEAAAMLAEQGLPGTRQVMVLLSDGMPYPEERRPLAVDAADSAAAAGITIHTVTFVQEDGGDYGVAGADAEFNASLVRNGGTSLYTPDIEDLEELLLAIGVVEIGYPRLMLVR